MEKNVQYQSFIQSFWKGTNLNKSSLWEICIIAIQNSIKLQNIIYTNILINILYMVGIICITATYNGKKT